MLLCQGIEPWQCFDQGKYYAPNTILQKLLPYISVLQATLDLFSYQASLRKYEKYPLVLTLWFGSCPSVKAMFQYQCYYSVAGE